MKRKVIPFLAVGVLIAVIVLFMVLANLIEKYTPTKERQELSEYYGLTSEDEAAIVLNNEVLDSFAKRIDGNIYLDFALVHDRINKRFYWDSNENKLLYVTADGLVSADAGSSSYNVARDSKDFGHVIAKAQADTVYIAADFLKQYSDFTYEIYEDPSRILLTNSWGDITVAPAKKDTEIRYQGGIKSPILADVAKGTELTVLNPDETWTKVATADGIIGYIKSKYLGSAATQAIASDYVPEEYSHISKDYKICLGWHQVTVAESNSTVSTVLANAKGLNVISPTWFYLNDNNGNIACLADIDYVNYCHQNGVEVWALVSNLENLEVDTTEVLSYTSRRETLINNLISYAIQYNLDGINVDFESLEAEAGDAFVEFIRELSIKCRNNGIVLSVDNYVPTSYTAFYDREEQAAFADYIIIMAYDEHHSASEEAGPVASIGFVRDGVTDTLKEVPASQVILGMPFYTRVWSETPIDEDGAGNTDGNDTDGDGADGTSEEADAAGAADSYTLYELDSYATNMDEIQNLISVNGVTPVWSEDAGQYYAEYVNGGVTYKIWVEDASSLEEKLKVYQENGLAGGAFWKLSLENPAVWDTIIKYIN